MSAATERHGSIAAPRFRDDLEIVPEDRTGVAPRYIVRDPASDRVFVLSEETWFLCRALDGATPTAEVAARYRERFGVPFDVADLDAFVRQLASEGLLDAAAGPRTLPERLDGPPPHFELRLGYVDPWLTWLERHTRWLFGTAGKLAAAALVVLGVVVLISSWSAYIAATGEISLVRGVVPALLYLIVGGVVRLTAQGLVLKRHEQQLLDLNLTFAYYVVPVLAADMTSSMLLREKYDRLRCIWAGVWAQFAVWALALMAWRFTTPGTTLNTLFLATSVGMLAGTFVLSLNPLLQTDGYWLLSFWLDSSRMRSRALRAFGDWLYGLPRREPVPRRERRWLTAYGACCFLYYVGVRCLIVWAVGTTWATKGAGAVFTIALGAILFEQPLTSYLDDFAPLRSLRTRMARAPRSVRRLGVALLVLLIALIPYPYEIGGPMVLLPIQRTEINAEVEGLVDRVMVSEGQQVKPGEPIAELSRWEYDTQLGAMRQELVSKEAELQLLRLGAKPEVVARAELEVKKAEEQVHSAAQQVEALTVRLQYSEAHCKRYQNLYAEDSISRQDYENALRDRDMAKEQLDVARAQADVSRTSLDVARAELEAITSGPREEQVTALEADVERLRIMIRGLEEQLRLTVMHSPVSGRVSTPHVQQKAGHYLHKGELFAVIEESSTIQAEVQVPEEDVSDLRPDARVKIVTWTYPDHSFIGRVLFVAPIAANAAPEMQWRVVRVLTELPNEDGLLKPAMTGYAKIKAPWRPLWKVFLWPPIRWLMVQVWYWLP